MRGPYGFEPISHCQTCKSRSGDFFCQLSPTALKEFDAIKSVTTYPAGAVLFIEKQEPRGVFMLCAGEIKLSISSSEGRTLILRIARPGEILGLMAVMAGKPYEVTAETLHPCQVAYIRREDFQRYVAKHPEASHGVIRQLTTLYQGACDQLRTVGLSASAHEKLARLLLDWATDEEGKEGTKVLLPLTQEEIAEFIGTTRETVTRTLSEFKHRQLVALRGSTLMISNREVLESIGGV